MGYLIHSFALRHVARHEFKAALISSLPKEALDRIALYDIEAKGKWEEEGREFWLNGKLYDVVRQEQSNGITYLYCLSDVKEEQVVKDQAKITSHNTNSNGKNSKAIKFGIPDFIVVSNEVSAVGSILLSSLYTDLSHRAVGQKVEPVSPPPQL